VATSLSSHMSAAARITVALHSVGGSEGSGGLSSLFLRMVTARVVEVGGAALSPSRVRALQSYKAMSDMMIKNSLVKIKEHPPYIGDMEGKVLLNSMARATFDPKTGEYSFKGKLPSAAPVDTSNVQTVSTIFKLSTSNISSGTSIVGVGVDQELISSVPSHNETFVARNFTKAEIAYCGAQPSPSASFAARWVGKEAVFKSLGVKSKGASAPMKDIEIINDEGGVPTVRLHGDARVVAEEKGISNILISLSHSESVAIAFAQATL